MRRLSWMPLHPALEKLIGGDLKHPRIFAEDLSSLPPAIIAVEYDTLRDEARTYADRLRASGVETQTPATTA